MTPDKFQTVFTTLFTSLSLNEVNFNNNHFPEISILDVFLRIEELKHFHKRVPSFPWNFKKKIFIKDLSKIYVELCCMFSIELRVFIKRVSVIKSLIMI